ncbi:MAG: ComF family protein [Candidatus Nanopelagicaceae bacterium]
MDFDKRKEGIFSALTSLVFPKICIYCQVEFAPLCLKCQQFWLAPVQRRYVKGLAVNSILAYNAASSRIVIQAKESRNRVAQFWMAKALSTALEKFELDNPALSISHSLLVPIPSSRTAIRRRGGSFLHPILDKLVELQKQKNGVRWRWKELLTHQKSVRDQSKLSYTARQSNMASAFRLISDDLVRERPILLIDDVLTTGATLDSAFRALRERNLTVLGAATVCASAHRLLIR